ncbi:hypothetical protein [Cupriavidus pauculus]|uniref:hypothetical protein n=1 Tax=Cupriavidus pauculus TaxID=82633 RepID=UPI0011AFA464|nr:hypothetical protein [Cupriavidus pauculus]
MSKRAFGMAPPVNRPLPDNGSRGFGMHTDPPQLLATDDKETAILHNFCDPVSFTVSIREITGFGGKFPSIGSLHP